VKQLAPTSLEKSSASAGPSPTLVKRNPELQQMGDWLGAAQKLAYSALLGCVIFAAFKILAGQFGHTKPIKFPIKHQHENSTTTLSVTSSSSISHGIWNRLGKVAAILNIKPHKNHQNFGTDGRLEDHLICRKREMAIEEAEELVKLWQDIKAEALGPLHQISPLSSILDESMLEKVIQNS
jgi:ARC6-like, IMS domain